MGFAEGFKVADLPDPSRPTPQEGVRLMQAFLQIRRPALREAIVELVARIAEDDGFAALE